MIKLSYCDNGWKHLDFCNTTDLLKHINTTGNYWGVSGVAFIVLRDIDKAKLLRLIVDNFTKFRVISNITRGFYGDGPMGSSWAFPPKWYYFGFMKAC